MKKYSSVDPVSPPRHKTMVTPLTAKQQRSLRKQLQWRAEGVSGKTKAQRRAEEAWRRAHEGDPMAGLQERFGKFFEIPRSKP